MPLLPALLLAAAAARAADPAPPPPVSLTVSDDLGEASYRPRFSWFNGSLQLTPIVKAGALALMQNFPYAYPILRQSPFAEGGFSLAYHGTVDVMAVATAGYVDLRSHRLVDDPNGDLGSTASAHPGTEISQHQVVTSQYLDVGKTFKAGAGWKGAVYAAFDQFTIASAHPTPHNFESDALTEGSLGTSWLRSKHGRELSLWADVSGETTPKDPYRNDNQYSIAPAEHAGAEYALVRPGGARWLAGTDLERRRADEAVRPYVGYQTGTLKALLGAEWRRSRSDFYPDVAAVSASVQGRVARDLTAGVTARYASRSFSMAPGAVDDTRVMGMLTWTPGAEAVVHAAKSWGRRRRPEYDAGRDRALNASITDAQRQEIRAVIAASPTLPDFLHNYRARSSLDVLAALSEFTSLFNQWNYNENEGHPPNLDSIDQIYQHARQSYLTSTADPMLVCLGAAQYAAATAELIGKQAGLEIQATATTVKVPDAAGNASGHAVPAVKTKDYGIVFVDWGRLIPTYTWDTERALRLYQALVGVPAMFHEITDPGRNGRHVGYLFTEEGKLYIRNLTFHDELPRSDTSLLFDDDPRGDSASAQRYRDLLRTKP